MRERNFDDGQHLSEIFCALFSLQSLIMRSRCLFLLLFTLVSSDSWVVPESSEETADQECAGGYKCCKIVDSKCTECCDSSMMKILNDTKQTVEPMEGQSGSAESSTQEAPKNIVINITTCRKGFR